MLLITLRFAGIYCRWQLLRNFTNISTHCGTKQCSSAFRPDFREAIELPYFRSYWWSNEEVLLIKYFRSNHMDNLN